MQQLNNSIWGDAHVALSNSLGIKHHALLYSRKNLLANISTYEIEANELSVKNTELVLEEAGA